MDSLRKLFEEEIKDLYDAESQLEKALPRLAEASKSPDLKRGFQQHLEATRRQKQRLEQISGKLGFSPEGKPCKGMAGLVKEGEEVVKEDMPSTVRDAALIASAQKVEHYEIAGYGTARTFAELLDLPEVARLLQQTLDEEGETDHRLSALAEGHINAKAFQATQKKEK